MVSPLQSVIAGVRQQGVPDLGSLMREQAITNSNLQTADLQRQNIQQQMGERKQQLTAEQSLGAARYLNFLGKQLLASGDEQWASILEPQLPQLQQLGYTPNILRGMTREQVAGVVQQTEPLVASRDEGTTGAERMRQMNLKALEGAMDEQGNLKPEKQLTAKQRAAAIDLGLIAKANLTAEERKALDADLGEAVAKQKGRESESTETARQNVLETYRPRIEEKIALAKSQAKERGEAISLYNQAVVSMPEVEEVVGKLRELAPLATSTTGGKIFDLAAKELGFGSTQGATARAKYIATINNQVLPLLKLTFGSAFTESDRVSLQKTLGDPDSGPEQKMAELDAFIEAKMRSLESAERGIRQSGANQPAGGTSPQQKAPRIIEVDF